MPRSTDARVAFAFDCFVNRREGTAGDVVAGGLQPPREAEVEATMIVGQEFRVRDILEFPRSETNERVLETAEAREQEAALGETLEKMQKWKELTSGAAELTSVDASHMGCMRFGQGGLFDKLLAGFTHCIFLAHPDTRCTMNEPKRETLEGFCRK